MQKRTLGIVLMVVGVAAVIVSLAPDTLGIGGHAGVGLKQALGAVVGVIVAGVGAWYWPGFPRSRMMAEAATPAPSGTPKKSGGTAAARKQKAAKSSSRSARKGTARGSRRRGKR